MGCQLALELADLMLDFESVQEVRASWNNCRTRGWEGSAELWALGAPKLSARYPQRPATLSRQILNPHCRDIPEPSTLIHAVASSTD